MDVEVVTPPSAAAHLDVLSVAQAKAHLRIGHNAEDQLIADYIAAAVAYIDGRTGLLRRAVLPATFNTFGPRPATPTVYLPLPPVTAITSVSYLDPAGVDTVLAPAHYRVSLGELRGRVEIINGWPEMLGTDRDLRITFTAGYAASLVPPAVRHAIRLLVGHSYRNREAATEQNRGANTYSREIEIGVSALLAAFVVPPFADA